ncbi:hypothetical protein ACFY3U_24300 [Micromonospora sp. NPDC000089]|uniref:hypothetical protein n=1 Tax=unclassified Micromonospora TaxID=2617518 RepID=UPI0036861F98
MVDIAWADLGLVLVVGLLLGAGVVALYAVGIRALSTAEGPTGAAPVAGRAVAVLCFAICALAVGYGIYTLL